MGLLGTARRDQLPGAGHGERCQPRHVLPSRGARRRRGRARAHRERPGDGDMGRPRRRREVRRLGVAAGHALLGAGSGMARSNPHHSRPAHRARRPRRHRRRMAGVVDRGSDGRRRVQETLRDPGRRRPVLPALQAEPEATQAGRLAGASRRRGLRALAHLSPRPACACRVPGGCRHHAAARPPTKAPAEQRQTLG